jgi:16S rRNA (cytosine1402-N4)-methyltransferase
VTGVHAAVMAEEAVAALKVRGDGVYVDATFGRGGHSRLILARLGATGRLIAMDRDPEAVAAAQAIDDPRFSIARAPFSRIGEVLRQSAVAAVDGVLLDLGVSSPQIDEARRGFSFRGDGPLDMRMDPQHGLSAAQWLQTATEAQIREVIRDYGEERFAKQIAAAIVAARARGPVDTTRKLAALVAEAVPAREPRQDPATRTFQALRIHLNQELEELSLVLPQCVALLRAGGRLVVISFHSLEDRIVKRFMRAQSTADALPERLPVRAAELPQPPLRLVGRAQRATADEVARNPRARSAVLRVAERTEAPAR